MTSSRLLLAAGTAAAAVASVAPAVTHAGANAAAPVRATPAGVTVSATAMRDGATARARVVVPAGVTELAGAASGRAALAARVRLTIVRSSDGATLFTGSLATFHALPVTAGAALEVRVQKPVRHTSRKAGAVLQWS